MDRNDRLRERDAVVLGGLGDLEERVAGLHGVTPARLRDRGRARGVGGRGSAGGVASAGFGAAASAPPAAGGNATGGGFRASVSSRKLFWRTIGAPRHDSSTSRFTSGLSIGSVEVTLTTGRPSAFRSTTARSASTGGTGATSRSDRHRPEPLAP